MTDTSKEAPARLWAMKTAGDNWKEPLATPCKVDHFQGYVREDLYAEAIAERDALRAQLQAEKYKAKILNSSMREVLVWSYEAQPAGYERAISKIEEISRTVLRVVFKSTSAEGEG